jgi:hypothetical protein
MLKSLNVKNLTVFAEADLEFSPGLNVIVGAANKVSGTNIGYIGRRKPFSVPDTFSIPERKAL